MWRRTLSPCSKLGVHDLRVKMNKIDVKKSLICRFSLKFIGLICMEMCFFSLDIEIVG